LILLIVVVGVFIGIQVANWNDTRQAQARADDYAERLRTDLRVELESIEALAAYQTSTMSSGTDAYTGLMQATNATDESILINAYRATQFTFYERRRSTYDEIINAGVLNLIADVELRETAILIYASPLFDILQQEGQAARYRELFRMTVDPALQNHFGQQCGDRLAEVKHWAVGLLSLDYSCELTAGPSEISAAVAALREDEDIIRALRLRTVQLAGRIYDIELTVDALGLAALFADQAAP
jgi:hypothetical protein